MAAATFDLDDLDLKKPAEKGYEFEYISEANGPTGVFLTVLGDNSEKVQSFIRKRLNAMRQRDDLRRRKGKDDAIRTVEDDEQYGIELAAIRIVSWKGIKQECNWDNAVKLCTINPEILTQVIKESREIGNFIKSK